MCRIASFRVIHSCRCRSAREMYAMVNSSGGVRHGSSISQAAVRSYSEPQTLGAAGAYGPTTSPSPSRVLLRGVGGVRQADDAPMSAPVMKEGSSTGATATHSGITFEITGAVVVPNCRTGDSFRPRYRP
jgi:hypothetical protein